MASPQITDRAKRYRAQKSCDGAAQVCSVWQGWAGRCDAPDGERRSRRKRKPGVRVPVLQYRIGRGVQKDRSGKTDAAVQPVRRRAFVRTIHVGSLEPYQGLSRYGRRNHSRHAETQASRVCAAHPVKSAGNEAGESRGSLEPLAAVIKTDYAEYVVQWREGGTLRESQDIFLSEMRRDR